MVPAMTSSPAGVRPGPRPISRVAVRSAASRSARRTAPRSAASGPPGPAGRPGQREGAVRDALAVERVAQLAHALRQQGRAQAGQLGPRVPPRGGADGQVADDDPAAPDLGRGAAGQGDQRAAVARAEEHAAQRQPGGVAGQHADDVAAAVVGDVQVDGGRQAHEHPCGTDGSAQQLGDAGAGRRRDGGGAHGRAGRCAPWPGRSRGGGGSSGSPARAARPRGGASVCGRLTWSSVLSSMVRMAALRRGTTGGARPPARARSTPLVAEGGRSPDMRRRPTIQRAGWTGFEPMRRVARRLMAEVAKNGPRRPGTPDRLDAVWQPGRRLEGDAS